MTVNYGIQEVSGSILLIFTKRVNMTIVDYANRYLFEPLGITSHVNHYAKTAEEHKQFTIGKAPKGNI